MASHTAGPEGVTGAGARSEGSTDHNACAPKIPISWCVWKSCSAWSWPSALTRTTT